MKGHIRTGGAVVIGAALIVVAVLYAPDGSATTQDRAGTLAIANGASREYIPTEDSDQDGISDWKEQFERVVIEESHEQATTTEYTPPETLTGQMGLSLVQNFFLAASTQDGLSAAEKEQLVDTTLSSFRVANRTTTYTKEHLVVSDNSIAALRDYGNRLAEVLLVFTSGERTHEIDVLGESLATNNEELLQELQPIRITYRQLVHDLLVIPVPPELVDQHLNTINLTLSIYENLGVFEEIHHDPALALVHLNQYQKNVTDLSDTFFTVADFLFSKGVRYEAGEPGAKAIERFGLNYGI